MKTDLLNILIIDDESSMRHMLRLVLEQQGYRITEAKNGSVALNLLQQERFDAILCDIRMDEMGGLEFLQQEAVRSSTATIIMMSAYGSVDIAIECMKLGAYDYISKPFKPDEVVLALKKTEERMQLQKENLQLKIEIGQQQTRFNSSNIIHSSNTMADILSTVHKVAKSDAAVLIRGETGTGKELIAQSLHAESHRNSGPFLAVNCSTISAGLLESELFGHIRGSFTGANSNKDGLFTAACGGTLFLDEIAELPMELQPKLLRVLQENEIRPVGSNESKPIDTRIIAACGTNLPQAVKDNQFRSDLFYRLAVIEIQLPPLRNRLQDIPVLAEHFLREICLRENCMQPTLTDEAIVKMQNYDWPGNIRELKNYMEKTMIFSQHGKLELPSLSVEERQYPRNEEDFSLKQAALRLEREYINKALKKTSGNRTQAAKLLEISLRNLLYKIKQHKID